MVRIATGALAGLLAGVVVGAAARVAMRLVALGLPDGVMTVPIFTVGGTLVVVTVGAVAGAAFGVAYDAIAPRLRGSPLARGLMFAALGLLVIGPVMFLSTPDEFTSQGRVILFALLYPIFGIALGLLHPTAGRLIDRLPRAARHGLALVGLGATALIALGIGDALVGSGLRGM